MKRRRSADDFEEGEIVDAPPDRGPGAHALDTGARARSQPGAVHGLCACLTSPACHRSCTQARATETAWAQARPLVAKAARHQCASQYRRNLQSDARRLYQLLKHT